MELIFRALRSPSGAYGWNDDISTHKSQIIHFQTAILLQEDISHDLIH